MPNPLGTLLDRLSGKKGPSKKSQPRQVIIGLDFGTSGTKVAFRDWGPQEGGEVLHLIDFGTDPTLGFPRFAVPSTICIDGGSCYFGSEAEERSRFGRSTMRCLKTALLDPGIMESLPPLCQASPGPEADGPTKWKGGNEPEFLATLFLSHVLNDAWNVIREVYPGIEDGAFSVNLDVPVDNLEGAEEEALFRRICAHAMLMKSEIEQGIHRESALDLWQGLWESNAAADLMQTGGRAEVVAEGQALIQGVGVAQEWGSGRNYVTIDLGAGTTDVGIFRLTAYKEKDRRSLTRRIPFYSAMTDLAGCDSIDERLYESSGAQPAAFDRLRGAVRASKSQLCSDVGTDEVEMFGGWKVTRDSLQEAIRPTADRSFKHYQTAFGQAYKKDRNQCFWEELKVFVMGGGSMIPAFRERFWAPPRPIVTDVDLWDVDSMEGAKVVGASDSELSETEIPFLVVANGLSFSPAWMPELVTPDGVGEYGNIEKELGNAYDYDWEDGYSK
jgi:hypothetical protein